MVPKPPFYADIFQLGSLLNCLNNNLHSLDGGSIDLREFLTELELSESDVVQEILVRFHFQSFVIFVNLIRIENDIRIT